MIFDLKVVYDNRDNLEIWIPEFDSESQYEREPGHYETFFNARRKGAERAFDSLMIEGFSSSYDLVLGEVKEKETSNGERYNVPELDLYDVPLSKVLEYIYRNYVLKKREEKLIEKLL